MRACDYLKNASKLAPNDTELHIILGNCYNELDKLNDAIDQYNKALEQEPKNAAIRGYRHDSQKEGNLDLAIQKFKRHAS